MKSKRKIILFAVLIALVTVFTGTLGGCGCSGFSYERGGGIYFPGDDKGELDDKYWKTFNLYKEVESRQGNESDDLEDQFRNLVLNRVKQLGMGDFKNIFEAEDALSSYDVYQIYDDLYYELLQYRKLLMVIQGTWTRVSKYNSDFSWDDNGPQITLSIVGNHQVQLVSPQLGWVPAPDHKQHQDFAVVGQATDQYTCRMGEPSTDKRYVGKPIMMLSQGGKDIIFIVLNEDNTITINGAKNISTEELEQRFGEWMGDVVLDQTYSKVQ